MKMLRILLLAAFWLSTFALVGQESFSLERCVQTALSRDLSRQIAERQAGIARLNNHGSIAGRFPSVALNVNGQGNLTNQNNPASFLNGLIRSGNGSVSLDASWLVFNGFRVRYQLQQLGVTEQQALAALSDAGLQTVRRATLAYLDAEFQTSQVAIAREVLAHSREQLANQRTRQDLGQALTQQVLQSQDAVYADSLSLLASLATERTALNDLKAAMGDPNMPDFLLGGAPDSQPQVWDRASLVQKMLGRNPAVQEAMLAEQSAALQTRITRSGYAPRFNLTTGAVLTGTVTALDGNNPFTGEPFGTQTGSNRNAYLGITGSLPIYDAGIRRRQVAINRLQEEQAALQRASVEQQLTHQLDNLLALYQSGQDRIGVAGDRLANASRNLEIAEVKFRLGQMSAFDMRTVELAYARAALDRQRLGYDLRSTEVEILALTGELVR